MANLDTAIPSRMIFADTHCHLDFHAFDNDREEVLAAAQQIGVQYFLNPAIDLATSRKIVSLALEYEKIFAAVGVHPNDALTWAEDTQEQLRILSRTPKVVAIGEIGLDYYRNYSPRDVQQEIFLLQLELAKEVGLPVIIHTRQSISDTLAILKDWVDELQLAGSGLEKRPGVLHSFSGSWEDAQIAIDLGFWIGITGPVTFRNAPELQKIVANLPLEKILIETDAPFLAPHPMRGKRNQPSYVYRVAEKISELQSVPLEEVAKTTTASAESVFFGEKAVE